MNGFQISISPHSDVAHLTWNLSLLSFTLILPPLLSFVQPEDDISRLSLSLPFHISWKDRAESGLGTFPQGLHTCQLTYSRFLTTLMPSSNSARSRADCTESPPQGSAGFGAEPSIPSLASLGQNLSSVLPLPTGPGAGLMGNDP